VDTNIGKVIRSYELEGLIGTGGFGAVYRARQSSIAREVAIKIIWPAFASHPNFIRRFEAEAQLVAGLEHPHIVPVYDYWRDPEGAYIVMRYLRGGHLHDMLKGGALAVREVGHVLDNVAAALALAHRYGVVHRDIKPENILLDEEGNAYLADFGIAQILSTAVDEDDFAGMGSPAYAAPEQLQGGNASSQSDIYSLGVVLFEMLTGEHPFPDLQELSMTQLLRVRTTQPLPPLVSRRAGLPSALNDVIQRATALDPKVRYPDALSLAYAFREATGQAVVSVATNGRGQNGAEVLPNPYRGLRAFQESDAPLFFGRESLVRRLLNRLWENEEYTRFLAIVGPSGSGKSSVVQAGLVPALRQGALPGSENWFYAEFTPGIYPFQELANLIQSLAVTPPDNLLERLQTDERAFSDLLRTVLPDKDSEVLLVIDQFEEIFTLNADEKAAEKFIHALYMALVDPQSRLRLVVTIRADFYDRPLLTPRISELVRERTEVVVPLSLSELERVIVEPARRVGVTMDTALVATIIAEVQEQPGALPLLQYALTELFEKREGSVITPAAYRAIGGVRGALARRADEIYNRMDADHQEAMRQIFLRLITLGEGTEDTRRRALLSEIMNLREGAENRAIIDTVVNTLGRTRLLAFDRDPVTRSPTLEVTHEAIIREWGKLRAWLEESRSDVRLQRGLAALTHDWENSGRDGSFLLRGVRLQQYERWMQTSAIALTQQERAYLEASLAVRARQEQEEQERQQRVRRLEQRNINFLRLIIAGLILLVVGAVTLTGLALSERQRAEESAIIAEQNATLSRSIAFASSAQTALINDDGDLALVLALQANAVANPPIEARSTLAEAALERGTRARFTGHEAAVTSVAITRDGLRLASSSTDATVRVYDPASGQEVLRLEGHNGDVESVAFRPDGQQLASASTDFSVILWDIASGAQAFRLQGHTAPVRQALYTADGSRVLTASNDNLVIVWDTTSGQQVSRFEGHSASVLALGISPDDRLVLSGSRDGRLLLWELATGQIVRELVGAGGALTDLDISADGTLAVTAFSDTGIVLWDLTTGDVRTRFVGAAQEPRAVVFTPDGQFVISGGLDGIVHLWNVETGLIADRMTGHSGGITSLAVSVDGSLAVSGSQDRSVRLWNIGNPGQLSSTAAHDGRITEIVVDAEGVRYTTGVDGALRVWEADGTLRSEFSYTDIPIVAMAVNPAAEEALLGGRDGIIYRVNLTTGIIRDRLIGHTSSVQHLAYLPDGRQALSSSQTGELILWDLAQLLEVRRYDTGSTGAVNAFDVFAEGTRLVASTGSNTLRTYDLATGDLVAEFAGHSGSIYSLDVHPAGRLIASGARDGFTILWDAATGAETARLASNANAIWSVVFSPLGDQLASGSSDGVITVWDTAENDVLQRFTTQGTVFSLAFAPDARRLVSGRDSGLMNDWLVFRDDDAATWAQSNRYIRELDCFERDRYRVLPACDAAG
jgi:WD40 repeat protein